MLRIAVCIKQVPAYSEGTMDPETGVLQRAGLESVINVYDLPALETALRIKEEKNAIVDVFSMGPAKAAAVIREAYSMGADGGFLLSDKYFSGADVLATSYTLMQGIKSVAHYDLILCGRQTTDGDTAQVGGALARWMNIPNVNWVTELVGVDERSITVRQAMEDEVYTVKVTYPCLLSVERSIFKPRLPSLKLKIAANRKDIKLLTLESMQDTDSKHYGLKGSPTRVEKIYTTERTKRQEAISSDSENAAAYIHHIIKGLF